MEDEKCCAMDFVRELVLVALIIRIRDLNMANVALSQNSCTVESGKGNIFRSSGVVQFRSTLRGSTFQKLLYQVEVRF